MILSFINIHKVPREMLKTEGKAINIRKVPREMLSPRFSTPPSGPCEC